VRASDQRGADGGTDSDREAGAGAPTYPDRYEERDRPGVKDERDDAQLTFQSSERVYPRRANQRLGE
jgi:hypothetical protein